MCLFRYLIHSSRSAEEVTRVAASKSTHAHVNNNTIYNLFSLFSCRFLVWFLNQHMPTEEEANAAINALNGTMLHGYKMNVEVSTGQCANCRVDLAHGMGINRQHMNNIEVLKIRGTVVVG